MSRRSPRQTLDILRTGFTGDPDGLRAFATDLVQELAEADAAAWYRFGLIDGDPLPAKWILRGLPEYVFERQVDERIPWPHGDPRTPDPRWNRRVLRMRSVIPQPEEALWPSRLYRRCYEPAGIDDQLRMVVYHRGTFVAWIGAFRSRGQPLFSRADGRRLAPVTDAIADALISAEEQERAGGSLGCDLLLRHDGALEFASEAGLRLTKRAGFTAALTQWIRDVERQRSPPEVLFGHRVRWSRLYGDCGTRYLLHLEPIAPLRLSSSFVLSPTQRELAALAAAGATVAEIAQMKDLAPGTVQAHLRQVYERLGVGTRVELARALEAPAGPD